jgi:UDP-N-acetylmuramate: L-alanyl-gamma-D-glutamyl-meso-diaminopimelate ligase
VSHSPLDIYCIAIGGTGMAPLAALLKGAGHRVRGADGPLYPPMSTLLEAAGIEPLVGWDPAHLDAPTDLVIVGNAVPRHNPEAEEAERRGLPRASMPEALARFFLAGRRPLVVAGTHGKTTTSAMAAWVYTACGQDPGYLVGGLPRELPASFAAGSGERFIVEGDEYNAAYFDRGPKFLHYRPQTLILTSAEYDHADLYPTPESLLARFRQLVEGLPADGLLIAFGDAGSVRELAAHAPCRVLFYGLGEGNDLRPLAPPEADGAGTRIRLADPEAGQLAVPLGVWGEHNVTNALAVWAAARADGLPPAAVAAALGRFTGVARRLELLGEAGGVAVVDDFAHHPTAVAKSIGGLASRFPGRRRVILFEPRSLTAGRRFFHQQYREAFAAADRVLFAPLFYAQRLADDQRLDLGALAAELTADGTPATVCASVEALLERAVDEARPGDLLATMSSGSFEGLPRRLLAALAQREKKGADSEGG